MIFVLSCFLQNMRNRVYGGMETRFYLVSGKLVCISCYPSNVILGRYSTFHGSRFVVWSFHEKFVRFRAISSSHKSRRRRRVHLPHVAPTSIKRYSHLFRFYPFRNDIRIKKVTPSPSMERKRRIIDYSKFYYFDEILITREKKRKKRKEKIDAFFQAIGLTLLVGSKF